MLFVTGTDTGVGKTHFCSLFIRQLRATGLPAAGFKPLCCGDREDAENLVAASGNALSVNECNPVWMRFPASPYTASIVEERPIDLAQIRDQFASLRDRFSTLIVEGVGGWSVPIQRDYLTSDLAREFGLPVLVIALNRLGVLNHTLLTLAAIRHSGLKCIGVLLNHGPGPSDTVTATNASILDDLLRSTDTPFLGEIAPHATTVDGKIFAKLCSLCLPEKLLAGREVLVQTYDPPVCHS